MYTMVNHARFMVNHIGTWQMMKNHPEMW